MKSFNEYLTEMNDVPVPDWPPVPPRDLEGFRPILDELKVQTRSLRNSNLDPEVYQKIYALVNPFYDEMAELLTSYKKQGIGYRPNYQYRNAPVGAGNRHSNF